MPRILEKAKENCFVSNSIKSSIKIEPEVLHEQDPADALFTGKAVRLEPAVRLVKSLKPRISLMSL